MESKNFAVAVPVVGDGDEAGADDAVHELDAGLDGEAELSRLLALLAHANERLQGMPACSLDAALYRSAAVKAFELGLEACNSMLCHKLRLLGADAKTIAALSYREVARAAARRGIVDTDWVERLFVYRALRNAVAHGGGARELAATFASTGAFEADARRLVTSIGAVPNHPPSLGLLPRHALVLDDACRRCVRQGTEVLAWGPRVTGGWTAASDLQLVVRRLVEPDKAPPVPLADFRNALLEAPLPFTVDLQEWQSLRESARKSVGVASVVVFRHEGAAAEDGPAAR